MRSDFEEMLSEMPQSAGLEGSDLLLYAVALGKLHLVEPILEEFKKRRMAS